MERTARKIAVPGKIAQWGAWSRVSLASKRMRPHVGMSGGKPRPRNESVDSAMMAAATSSEAAGALSRPWRAPPPWECAPLYQVFTDRSHRRRYTSGEPMRRALLLALLALGGLAGVGAAVYPMLRPTPEAG